MKWQFLVWVLAICIASLLFYWQFENGKTLDLQAVSEFKPAQHAPRDAEDLEKQVAILCQRLEAAVRRRMPDAFVAGEFNPPASDETIKQLELFAGGPLPAGFRAYLEIMNGQKGRVALPGVARLLSAEEILKYSSEQVGHLERSMKKLPLSLKGYPYWHPRLLFVSYRDGDGDVIDSVTGELRTFAHDGGVYEVSHDRFLAFLEQLVEAAEDNEQSMLDFGPPRPRKKD